MVMMLLSSIILHVKMWDLYHSLTGRSCSKYGTQWDSVSNPVPVIPLLILGCLDFVPIVCSNMTL